MFRHMARKKTDAGDAAAEGRSTAPVARVIAEGPDWRICDHTCHAGPRDRPYEEKHDGATIAAVVAGSFSYRTDSGRALSYPGAFLLGNAGTCFECGHDHSTGDRCIAFNFLPAFFAEISASAAGTSPLHVSGCDAAGIEAPHGSRRQDRTCESWHLAARGRRGRNGRCGDGHCHDVGLRRASRANLTP